MRVILLIWKEYIYCVKIDLQLIKKDDFWKADLDQDMALVPGEIHLCSCFRRVVVAGKPLELKQPRGG